MVCAGITYRISYNRITIQYSASDGTRGASFTDPYTFADIYDTSVANGWDLVSKLENYYRVDNVELRIYGSATYFKDTACTVKFVGTTTSDIFFNCLANAQFIDVVFEGSGHRWADENTYSTNEYNRCVFKNFSYLRPSFSVEFLNCAFFVNTYIHLYPGNLYQNCAFYGGNNLWIQGTGGGAQVSNSLLANISHGPWIDAYYWNGVCTLRDLKIVNSTYDITFRLGRYAGPKLTMIDCQVDLDRKSVTVRNDPKGSAEAILKSTFRAEIKDGSGASLVIYDKEGELAYSEILTSENMTEQEITYDRQYYENEYGVITVNQRTTYEPFLLKVSKAGYQELVISGITITAGLPTTIRGELVPIPATTFIDRRVQGAIAARQITGTTSVKRLSGTVRTRKEIEGEVKT